VASVSVPIKDFLKARRDRAVGSILGHAEREIYPQLTTEQQRAMRQVTLDALNAYHDSVLDLVKSEDGLRNEEVVTLLSRVDRHLAQRSG
jgi:hypothetical protein